MLARDNQDISLMSPCNHEEADSRLYVHANDACVRQNFNKITIHTVDTDVVVLGVAFSAKVQKAEIIIAVGNSIHLKYFNPKLLALH